MSRSSTVIRHFVSWSFYAAALFTFSLLIILITAHVSEPFAKADSISISTVPVGSSPARADVNLYTNKIYVANSMSNSVTVIDGNDNTTATVAAGIFPNDIAVNQLTNKIYVANYFGASVTVIDGNDNSTVTIPVGSGPGKIAVNPLTNKIYVTNESSREVTIINGADNSTSAIFIGAQPGHLALDLIRNKIYFTVPSTSFVCVLDGHTNSLTNVPGVAFPAAMALNPVTNRLYLAASNADQVILFDGVHGSTETIGVGSVPRALAVNSLTNKIYVTDAGGDDLTVIDGNDNSTSSIAIGFSPSFVTTNPAVNKIYTGSRSDGRVIEIDGASTLPVTFFTDATPYNAVVNPITNKVYVVNTTPSVTVIDPAPKNTSALNTVITPLPGNITGNSSPSFTFTATSNSPDAPPLNIYFQVDTTAGAWTHAENIGQTGTTLTARAAVDRLQQGMHIIYFFASDSADATSINSLPGNLFAGRNKSSIIAPTVESSPVTGGINAYPFYVILNPTAAEVSVSGRILTPGGNGLRNAWIELTDSHGISRATVSSSLGYYRFEGVRTSEGYVINASAKRYRFDPQLLTVNSEMTNIDFIARGGSGRARSPSSLK
jgi:YVTN family beta-propeller protein